MKYKLNISVNKGMTSTPFKEQEIDTKNFVELFRIGELETFNRDAYLTCSLEELQENKEL